MQDRDFYKCCKLIAEVSSYCRIVELRLIINVLAQSFEKVLQQLNVFWNNWFFPSFSIIQNGRLANKQTHSQYMFERDFYQCLTHSKGVESLSKTNNLMPEKSTGKHFV